MNTNNQEELSYKQNKKLSDEIETFLNKEEFKSNINPVELINDTLQGINISYTLPPDNNLDDLLDSEKHIIEYTLRDENGESKGDNLTLKQIQKLYKKAKDIQSKMNARDYLQHWYQHYHNSADEWLHHGLILADQEGKNFTLSDYNKFCDKFDTNHGGVFKYAKEHKSKVGDSKREYFRQDVYYYNKFKLVSEYNHENIIINLYNIKRNPHNSIEIDNPDIWD